MNFNAFNLDVASAKKADQEGGRINRTDKFIGAIKRFEFIVAKTGAQGVEILFETDSKEEASMILYTFKADGTPIFGRDKVNALMACVSVKTLTPTDTTAEKYDFDVGSKIMQPVTIAPELTNKRIGLLIQMEEYENNSGQVKLKPQLISSFNPDNNLMAQEILELKTTPEQLDKAYARLMKMGDKKLPTQQSSGGYGYGQSTPSGAGGATSDLDDDLPFQHNN